MDLCNLIKVECDADSKEFLESSVESQIHTLETSEEIKGLISYDEEMERLKSGIYRPLWFQQVDDATILKQAVLEALRLKRQCSLNAQLKYPSLYNQKDTKTQQTSVDFTKSAINILDYAIQKCTNMGIYQNRLEYSLPNDRKYIPDVIKSLKLDQQTLQDVHGCCVPAEDYNLHDVEYILHSIFNKFSSESQPTKLLAPMNFLRYYTIIQKIRLHKETVHGRLDLQDDPWTQPPVRSKHEIPGSLPNNVEHVIVPITTYINNKIEGTKRIHVSLAILHLTSGNIHYFDSHCYTNHMDNRSTHIRTAIESLLRRHFHCPRKADSKAKQQFFLSCMKTKEDFEQRGNPTFLSRCPLYVAETLRCFMMGCEMKIIPFPRKSDNHVEREIAFYNNIYPLMRTGIFECIKNEYFPI